MAEQQLKDVLEGEREAFLQECRQKYVEVCDWLGLPARLEDSVIVVGSSPAKAYVQAGAKAFQEHLTVLVSGKGEHLVKAIAVAEQIKQAARGHVVQLNRASLHSSLINPAYKPRSSLPNVRVFFGENEDLSLEAGEQASTSENDVLREIRGHKVYQVPSMAILLSRDTKVPDNKFSTWTRQTKS